jgi:hypothetical protein
MNAISNKMPSKWLILSLIPFLLFIALPCNAQMTTAPEVSDKMKGDNLKIYAEMELEYADNVFHLTEDQQSKMKSRDERDIHSGRFKDMESVSDYIIKPRIGLRYDAESPFSGKFGMASWIRYNYYTENEKSSYPEGRITLINAMGGKGVLSLEGNFVNRYFKKNYLSGVDDIDGNGNIPRGERIYSSAIYDEYEGILSYEHKIINDKDKMFTGLDVRTFSGLHYRKYNSPFDNRDQNIILGGLRLNLEFKSRIRLGLIYQYERVSSPNNVELILFDESIAEIDCNGDGKIKSSAPLITHIDRSSNRHTIEINPSIKLTKDASFYIDYSKRVSANISDNPLDIDHYNTKSYRQQIKTGITYSFSKAWSVRVEYSRTDDDDVEDEDYSQNKYLFTVRCNF